jgi:formylglycine-generating enzyme required for sulfatase activity
MIEDTQQLGKYRILAELGRGGFATVYRALDTTLEREVALKVLDPLLMRDEAWVERFRREARAVARLGHPHIVTIHEIDEADGRLFIAMELVARPTLKDLIAERGHLSWDETLDILAQLAEALDYAHSEDILHRDLKPGNILLDSRRGAVLTDFGFARLVGESSMSVSVSGGVVGTPQYIAPEVWEEKGATPPTDIYALACIVYEMLTGEALFGGETPAGVMRKHLIDGPQFPAAWPERVPTDVAQVLLKALAREPEERYGSAGEVVAALRTATRPEPATAPVRREAPRAGRDVADVAPPRVSLGLRALPGWAWGAVGGGGLVLAVLMCLGVTLGPRLFGAATEPTGVPAARPTPADTWTRPADGMVMVYVPAGRFEMGSDDDAVDYGVELCNEYYPFCWREAFEDERPAHTVALDHFWIDRYEVTNGQYRQCVEAGVCGLPSDTSSYPRNLYYGSGTYDDHPVINITWHDARAYCEWAGGRLPTEAEWEYAARGQRGRMFPWGDVFDGTLLNYCDANCESSWKDGEYDDGYAETAPVGSYPGGASWCGAEDMAGNVGEWVADWYDQDYYSHSPLENPAGPFSGDLRAARGGCWGASPHHALSASRVGLEPDSQHPGRGFRCARSSD